MAWKVPRIVAIRTLRFSVSTLSSARTITSERLHCLVRTLLNTHWWSSGSFRQYDGENPESVSIRLIIWFLPLHLGRSALSHFSRWHGISSVFVIWIYQISFFLVPRLVIDPAAAPKFSEHFKPIFVNRSCASRNFVPSPAILIPFDACVPSASAQPAIKLRMDLRSQPKISVGKPASYFILRQNSASTSNFTDLYGVPL